MSRTRSPSITEHLSVTSGSFGSTAAIVTSVGLIVGFGAVTGSRAAVVSALLIVAVADNITDSLSIHIYQESENIDVRPALRATVVNFLARLVITSSFVVLVVVLPATMVAAASACWGLVLLATLSFLLAQRRQVSPAREICIHLGVAVAVVVVSRALGIAIRAFVQ